MKKIIVSVIIFTFLFIDPAFAEISIKAEVDKTSISTDETLAYKIIITSSDKKLPLPERPKFTGFNILSSAQSSTISFMKSDIKTILVYAFILAPTNTGKFKIEPSVIKIKNKAYSSDAFEIEVKPGKVKPAPQESPPENQTEEPQVTL